MQAPPLYVLTPTGCVALMQHHLLTRAELSRIRIETQQLS
jgi:hypothetical protein